MALVNPRSLVQDHGPGGPLHASALAGGTAQPAARRRRLQRTVAARMTSDASPIRGWIGAKTFSAPVVPRASRTILLQTGHPIATKAAMPPTVRPSLRTSRPASGRLPRAGRDECRDQGAHQWGGRDPHGNGGAIRGDRPPEYWVGDDRGDQAERHQAGQAPQGGGDPESAVQGRTDRCRLEVNRRAFGGGHLT